MTEGKTENQLIKVIQKTLNLFQLFLYRGSAFRIGNWWRYWNNVWKVQFARTGRRSEYIQRSPQNHWKEGYKHTIRNIFSSR